MKNKEFLKRFANELAPNCTREQLQDFVESLWQEEANYLYACNDSINGIYPCPNNLPKRSDLFWDDIQEWKEY